jgi:hypothetical protein
MKYESAMTSDNKKPACTRSELHESSYLIRPVLYRKRPVSVIIFAFEDCNGMLYFAEKHLTLID